MTCAQWSLHPGWDTNDSNHRMEIPHLTTADREARVGTLCPSLTRTGTPHSSCPVVSELSLAAHSPDPSPRRELLWRNRRSPASSSVNYKRNKGLWFGGKACKYPAVRIFLHTERLHKLKRGRHGLHTLPVIPDPHLSFAGNADVGQEDLVALLHQSENSDWTQTLPGPEL